MPLLQIKCVHIVALLDLFPATPVSDCGWEDHIDGADEPKLAPVEWRRRSIGGDFEKKISTMAKDLADYGSDLLRDAQTFEHQKAKGKRISEKEIGRMKRSLEIVFKPMKKELSARFAEAKAIFLQRRGSCGKISGSLQKSIPESLG